MLKIKNRNKNQMKIKILLLVIWIIVGAGAAFAQITEFTYQGRLTDNLGSPLTGSFRLFDANNNLLGTQTRLGVPVSNGAFTAALDYGSNPTQFTGAARLLQISVRPAGSGSYADLPPPQPIISAPHSIRRRKVPTAEPVSISGHIYSGKGSGIIRRVLIRPVDTPTGIERATQINQRGFYRFDELEIGRFYTIRAVSRNFIFTPDSYFLELLEERENVNFTGERQIQN